MKTQMQIAGVLMLAALAGCGGGSSSANQAPALAPIADVTISANIAAPGITLSAMDGSRNLSFSATSANPDVIADGGLVLSTSGRTASLVITPLADQLGQAAITVSVTDPGGLTDQATFTVTVEPQAGVSLRQFVRSTFADAPTAVPRNVNSRRFEDDAVNDDFSDLVN